MREIRLKDEMRDAGKGALNENCIVQGTRPLKIVKSEYERIKNRDIKKEIEMIRQ